MYYPLYHIFTFISACAYKREDKILPHMDQCMYARQFSPPPLLRLAQSFGPYSIEDTVLPMGGPYMDQCNYHCRFCPPFLRLAQSFGPYSIEDTVLPMGGPYMDQCNYHYRFCPPFLRLARSFGPYSIEDTVLPMGGPYMDQCNYHCRFCLPFLRLARSFGPYSIEDTVLPMGGPYMDQCNYHCRFCPPFLRLARHQFYVLYSLLLSLRVTPKQKATNVQNFLFHYKFYEVLEPNYQFCFLHGTDNLALEHFAYNHHCRVTCISFFWEITECLQELRYANWIQSQLYVHIYACPIYKWGLSVWISNI